MITTRISSPEEYKEKFSHLADPDDNRWRWYIEEIVPCGARGQETINLAFGVADTKSEASTAALEMYGRMQEQGRI